ncbi:MAG: HTH marR-type domain-containing protein [Lachnoclostridium sp.]|jgi:MarR family transcriptional regulator, organic hydroperoxide resistance regulator
MNINHSNNPDLSFIQQSDDELLKLDNQLCFALYVCSKEIIRKYKPILDPLGLTYTGYITLLALWEKDHLTVKELGNRLYLDSGTLTPLLKKLEAQGYIKRVRSTHDERNVVIKLTPSGQELKKKAIHVPHELICSANLNDVDIKGLLENLHHFMEHMNKNENN